jgi:hypothetical protein
MSQTKQQPTNERTTTNKEPTATTKLNSQQPIKQQQITVK